MFGKKNSLDLSIAAENLAMPEIHVRDEEHPETMGKECADKQEVLSVLDAIAKRCSVRSFTDKKISEKDMNEILRAGMSGPSACNTRDWAFVVVTDKEILGKMADANGDAAMPLRNAAMGVLVCGDLEKAVDFAKEYWVIDGAIATQNMILAAKGLGIGSVWLGTWPQEDKVKKQSRLFDLPATMVPHSIVAFGYADGNADQTKTTWDESLVHFNKW